MDIDYHELGRRISARRRALGMKQTQICEQCDLSDKYLSAIECARSIPSLDVLLRICDALDTTPDTLLLGIRREEHDTLRNEIIQKLRGMTDKELILLSSFCDWLLKQKL